MDKTASVAQFENGSNLSRDDIVPPVCTHNPNVTFEEYLHYAAITRAQEAKIANDSNIKSGKPGLFLQRNAEPIDTQITSPEPGKSTEDRRQQGSVLEIENKSIENSQTSPSPNQIISHAEWETLTRATRNVKWSAIFFLITTDIFGPLSVPWAINQLGYGPGIVIYTVFGGLAGYTGYQIWVMFIHLDSDRYPLKTYSDVAYRVFGPWARHATNLLQSLQLFFNVGLLTLANGQSLSQLSSGKLCFVVCTLVFVIAGFLVGQIRALRTFSWLANFSVWFNVIILAVIMGSAAHSPPNYRAAAAQNSVRPGPVITSAGVPPGTPFENRVIGVMQAAYSYAGAMKRPWDFWKGMMCAQVFIYSMYLLFGLFVYSFQGQFAVLVSNQGLSSFVWQSIANGMGLASSLILACLYGNIGIKVIYRNIGTELLNFPSIESSRGKLIFAAMVPLYWILAFVVCSAVPSITSFSGLIAAVCVIQFSYTFPPILMLGFCIQRDAILPEETFNHNTGEVFRVDGGVKRWIRGMKKHWVLNLWNLVFALGAMATAVLGIYASIVDLIFVFKFSPAITSFTCTNPVGA
ncbi:amino acid transporter-like protein [Xylogone sp. PMI_703]|nr:amino acid transporter-like protein [Xylogone sp. PMI_703]